MFHVLVSPTAQKQLRKLPLNDGERVRRGLRALTEDPTTPRVGADIRTLGGAIRRKFRLRVGPFRIIFAVEGNEVYVYEVFRRGRGYR